MSNVSQQSEQENKELIRRVMRKDKAAITLLYHKYSGALLHLILKTIPDREQAEEVLQDVFVKVWEKADQFDAERGKLFTWLARIAKNSAIDTSRTGDFQRQAKTDSIESLVYNFDAHSQDPDITDSGLRKVVDGLEEKLRLLIDYLYFRGFTHQEASDALGIPLGTVKTRARMAILALREILRSEQFLLIAVAIIELLLS